MSKVPTVEMSKVKQDRGMEDWFTATDKNMSMVKNSELWMTFFFTWVSQSVGTTNFMTDM